MQIACGEPTLLICDLKRALAVEDLDALVAGVGDVDVAGSIAGDPAHPVELTLTRAGAAPGLEEIAVLVELRDAVVDPNPSAT